jgi:hypothetical protein
LGFDAGLSYIEIYVQKLNRLPNFEYEDDLNKRIPGICAGIEAQAVGGILSSACLGNTAVQVFSIGLEAAIGAGLSATFPLDWFGVKQNPMWGWDVAITDRLNGSMQMTVGR